MADLTRQARLDLESAIMDAKGDMLLMGLAVEGIEERCNESRKLGRIGDSGRMDVLMESDDIEALLHARNRLDDALKTLAAIFYGEKP